MLKNKLAMLDLYVYLTTWEIIDIENSVFQVISNDNLAICNIELMFCL